MPDDGPPAIDPGDPDESGDRDDGQSSTAAEPAVSNDDTPRTTGESEPDPNGEHAPVEADPGIDTEDGTGNGEGGSSASDTSVPPDVRRYERFEKMDGATYERANAFLRDRTYITAREWAIARLCTDFRTETGVEMTKIGRNLPRLVPFMTDTYTPQAVNQARSSFEDKVRKAGATFLYGAMSDFFTAEELDDLMYEATEIAKFLLEVEGADLAVEEELAAEDRISSVMREVHRSSAALRHDELECPHCGRAFDPNADRSEE